MNHSIAALLLAATGVLGACHDSISTNDQPVTGNHPAPPADTVAILDTTATAPAGGTVPFVHPTKSGRGLGIKHPSPPASRTR